MIEIGIVGLDTSHPSAFADVLEEKTGVSVTAVWDGGDVRDPAYAEEFADRFGTDVYDRVEEMPTAVDAAMVLTVNWDTHLELVTPFLAAGVPTFVDKPVAGRLEDVDRMERIAGETPVFGGSAVPFHPRFQNFPVDEPDRTLYCAGYNDPFYYGSHVVHVARRFVGADWTAVEPCPGERDSALASFENGARATVQFDGPQEDSAYGILDVGTETRVRRVDGNTREHARMYDRFLDAFVEVLRGDRSGAERLFDGARLLLASHAALESGQAVTPDSDVLADFHADGEAFLADYAPYY